MYLFCCSVIIKLIASNLVQMSFIFDLEIICIAFFTYLPYCYCLLYSVIVFCCVSVNRFVHSHDCSLFMTILYTVSNLPQDILNIIMCNTAYPLSFGSRDYVSKALFILSVVQIGCISGEALTNEHTVQRQILSFVR